MVDLTIEELKKKYPNIWRELTSSGGGIQLKISDPLRGYNPTVIDFIQRAETKEEALEVIDYLEKRGELPHPYAEELRKNIRLYGPRYYGPKREPGYYLKKYYLRENKE